MPYLTGVANSYADLRTALVAGLVANGWAQTGEILHKGGAYLAVESRETFGAGNNTSDGLTFQGGTGIDSGALLNPSAARPRLGRGRSIDAEVSWPVEYHIHIHAAPDEVYVLVRFNVDFWTWAAFGVSSTPDLGGSGMWITGQNSRERNHSDGTQPALGRYALTLTEGGVPYGTSWYYAATPGAPFWETGWATNNVRHADFVSCAMHCKLDAAMTVQWAGYRPPSGGVGAQIVGAPWYAAPLLGRLPNAWNSESVLLPMQVYMWRPESKVSLVLDAAHARYTRIDNYEPGEVFEIGPDRWKAYPFIRKNTAARDAGPFIASSSGITHSGTLGWAIRYDGA